jgi:hypothetical protein
MKYLKEYLDFRDIDDINECDEYPEFKGHEDFCRFLVDNGLIEDYINMVGGDIDKILEFSRCDEYINSVFIWDYSRLGRGVWSKMHRKWVSEYCYKD